MTDKKKIPRTVRLNRARELKRKLEELELTEDDLKELADDGFSDIKPNNPYYLRFPGALCGVLSKKR
jgi:hypothetical protein